MAKHSPSVLAVRLEAAEALASQSYTAGLRKGIEVAAEALVVVAALWLVVARGRVPDLSLSTPPGPEEHPPCP